MLEPRIYRAAFIPALLAFVIGMFSLESRPPAVQQALAADILFDGRIALGGANRLADAFPDRRPGTEGDLGAAARVADSLRAQNFNVLVDRFRSEDTDLVNVVGRRVGETTRQLVVVAPRDAERVPDAAGSAADTASLIEIARTLQGRVTQKSLVLASLDGSTLGAAGARRLAEQLAATGPVEAVVVLTDTGFAQARGGLLIPWSEGTVRGGLRLQRTLGESLRLELQRGGAGRSPGTASQFARLAFPLGIGDQAAFLDAGFNALRVSGSGELRRDEAQPRADADRLGSIGRATLRTVFAYDSGGAVDEEPSSFLLVGQNQLPRWSVALLVFTLLLPLFAASVDGFARARRRREPVLPWLRWVAAGLVPFALTLGLAEFLVLVGQSPDAPPIPLPPDVHELDGAGGLALVLCALVFLLAWLFLRPRVAGRPADPASPGAAAALALVLSLAAVALWIVNPFAALAFVPAFHLWLVVTGSPVAPARPLGVALVLAGMAIPLLILLTVFARLSLGPLSGAWYGFLLVTGHHIGLYTAALAALLLVCFAGAIRVALAREPEQYRAR